tara:strand:- start:1558 stop:2541 length:984 start_codon:yes stop_codon:yes gene_type:complete
LNILLLGGSGQDAFYLSSYLAKHGARVTWIYRGKALSNFQKYFEEDNILFIQVESYGFDDLATCVEIDQFDSIVLIAGVVGNQKGRNDPLYTYSQNMMMVNTICSLIVSSIKAPHLYYFSTSDVDGASSVIQPSIFSLDNASPKTTYGLSKLHSSEYLKFLMKQGIMKSTIIYLGMHESFYRSGDYVLSKIKKIINLKRVGQTPPSMTFRNLNLYIDIGFAQEYMNLVGQLIVSGFQNEDVVIGTGKYTNLHGLCIDILKNFDLNPNQYILIEPDRQEATYYPLVPFSLAGLPLAPNSDLKSCSMISPAPLTGEVLKCEYEFITRNE